MIAIGSKYIEKLKCLIFSAIAIIMITTYSAQDVSFTQFYANKILLNPAFTGLGQQHRFAMNYRDQWPGISEAFRSYSAAFDTKASNLNSGFGTSFLQDKAGSGAYTLQKISAYYAYHIDLSDLLKLSFGTSVSINQRSIDPSKYLFADQIINGGSSSTNESIAENHSYSDVSAGILLINHTNWWLGTTIDHLPEPDQSMLGKNSILQRRTSIHAGKRVLLKNSRSKNYNAHLIYAFHYQYQAAWDALDIGSYYKKGPITFGLWYKGLPIKKSISEYMNHDALSCLLGLEINSFYFGYSYDITVSKLRGSTKGAHEISMALGLSRGAKREKPSIIPCPKF